MQDRFMFRAWNNTYKQFIFRTLFEAKETILSWEQCTGLKDKNGRLIYERDVVKDDEGFIGVVRYDEVCARFEIDFIKADISDFERDMSWDLEVIGNIHENPELVEE